jgi:putative transcriptional regulator
LIGDRSFEKGRDRLTSHKKVAHARKDSVGKKLIEGLREFTEALEGDERISEKFTCRKITLDLLPVSYSAKTVKTTRKLLGVSQAVFAQFLGVSVKTVCAWEQGKTPGDMACRFMDEIRGNPEYWCKRLRESIRVKDAS